MSYEEEEEKCCENCKKAYWENGEYHCGYDDKVVDKNDWCKSFQ